MVCAECERGGDLLACRGSCGRAFHPRCIALPRGDLPRPGEQWRCADCELGLARCLGCGAPALATALQACAHADCAARFHATPECTAQRAVDAAFQCARHRCGTCGKDESAGEMAACVRCPRAFHRQVCMPLSAVALDDGAFMCADHAGEPAALPPADAGLVRRARRLVRLRARHERAAALAGNAAYGGTVSSDSDSDSDSESDGEGGVGGKRGRGGEEESAPQPPPAERAAAVAAAAAPETDKVHRRALACPVAPRGLGRIRLAEQALREQAETAHARARAAAGRRQDAAQRAAALLAQLGPPGQHPVVTRAGRLVAAQLATLRQIDAPGRAPLAPEIPVVELEPPASPAGQRRHRRRHRRRAAVRGWWESRAEWVSCGGGGGGV